MKEKKNAYVTFVMRNDSFIPGALVLAYSIKKHRTQYDLVCLITTSISSQGKSCLEQIYDKVIIVDEIYLEHSNSVGRSDRSVLFTRLQCLRLGSDGGLGTNYEKIVVLDADIMFLKNNDELFELETPAGIINEAKDHFLPLKNAPSIYPCSSNWYTYYQDICPHSSPIPQEITDRVWDDETILGVNACLWVLSPSKKEFDKIMKALRSNYVKEKIQRFNWPEMQYMTYFWSGKWHSIDYRFAAYNGLPDVNSIFATHYAGLKPWDDKKMKALLHYRHHPDYQLWYTALSELFSLSTTEFLNMPKMKRLQKLIQVLNK